MSSDPREQRAEAAAGKARLKAMRPWYKKKRFILPIALVVLILIVAIASGGGDDGGDGTPGTGETQTQEDGSASDGESTDARLYPDRPDAQPEDQERAIGQSATINGLEGTVTSGAFRAQISEFETDGYLVIEVSLRNTHSEARPYNTFNWRIQTPSGQVLDPYFGGDQLGSGDLVQDGTTSGQVTFEVGDQKGDFYVVWKPEPFDAARGIWRVTI